MHHLDVVAGAFRADEGAAGRAVDLRGHLGDHWLDAGIGLGLAARHHARAFERAFLAARDAHAEEADALLPQLMEAPVRVGEQRIAAIDDDVVGLEMRDELGDDVVDGLAGLDHDDDGPRAAERRHELRNGLRGGEAAFRAMRRHQVLRASAMAIVDRDAETLSGRIAREISPHGG
jgi:hypothetical protein